MQKIYHCEDISEYLGQKLVSRLSWKGTKVIKKLSLCNHDEVSCSNRAARTVAGSSAESLLMLVDMSASTWIEKAWLPSWPLYNLQVSHQRWIWASKKACKGSTLALKPRAYVTRSPNQGYQWPHKKDLCPPKFLKKVSCSYRNWNIEKGVEHFRP